MTSIKIPENDLYAKYVIGSTPATGPFPIDFPFFRYDDVQVWWETETEAAVKLVRDVDYELIGNPVNEDLVAPGETDAADGYTDGDINLLEARASGNIIIIREMVIERMTDLPVAGAVNMAAVNIEYDRLAAICQQLQAQIDRSLRFDRTHDPIDPNFFPGVTDGDKGDIIVGDGGTNWILDAGVVENINMAQVPAFTLKGNQFGGSTFVQDLDMASVTFMLPAFAGSTKGLVPDSLGETNLFLRADGTWQMTAASVSDGDKGDITVNGSGSSWQINAAAVGTTELADDAVTQDKLDSDRLKSIDDIPNSGFLAIDHTGNVIFAGELTEGIGIDIDKTNPAFPIIGLAQVNGKELLYNSSVSAGPPSGMGVNAFTLQLLLFGTSNQGVVPASGGGSTNFLRADGSWAAPPSGGGVSDGDKGDIVVSGSGATWSIDPLVMTAAGRALMDDASADAQLTTLGLSANGKSLVTAANYAAMRALLDLEAGTDFLSPAAIAAAYQPLDASLTAYATLVTAANKFISYTAADTPVTRDITAAGLALLDDAAATNQLTTLGLSNDGKSLVTAANYAAMRALLDLEAGTDFLTPAAIAAAYQPLDSDLTAIAALTTTAAGRSVLAIADPNADRMLAWDDSVGAVVPIALADIATEAAPATGDFLLAYTDLGALVKINWSSLPAGGGGISDGDKGDITVSGTGTVWNIDAGVVGTTELADDSVTQDKLASARLKSIEDIVGSGFLAIDGTGNVIFKGNLTEGLGIDIDNSAPAAPVIGLAEINGKELLFNSSASAGPPTGMGVNAFTLELLNFGTGNKGVVPASGASPSTKVLWGDGTWAAPPGGDFTANRYMNGFTLFGDTSVGDNSGFWYDTTNNMWKWSLNGSTILELDWDARLFADLELGRFSSSRDYNGSNIISTGAGSTTSLNLQCAPAAKAAKIEMADIAGASCLSVFRAIKDTMVWDGSEKLRLNLDTGDLNVSGNVQGSNIVRGSGAAEASVTAPVGTIRGRSDGTSGKTLEVKESGAGNTGWKNVFTEIPIIIACSDETTNLTTGTAKVTFRAPFAMKVNSVKSSLSTVSSSGLVTCDINEAGTSILGANKLSIDASEKTSVTAATATSISDANIADDAEITIDIDAAGTGAKGLKVTMMVERV